MSPRSNALHSTRVPPSSRRCFAGSPESRASCTPISLRMTDSVNTFEPITISAVARRGAIDTIATMTAALSIAERSMHSALCTHKFADEFLRWLGREIAVGAFLHYAPGAHQHQPAREERRFRHVMRH